MVTRYGMSSEIGMLSIDRGQESYLQQNYPDSSASFGPVLAHQVTTSVSDLLNECYELAIMILNENSAQLKDYANQLLLNETLDSEALKELSGTLTHNKSTHSQDLQ